VAEILGIYLADVLWERCQIEEEDYLLGGIYTKLLSLSEPALAGLRDGKEQPGIHRETSLSSQSWRSLMNCLAEILPLSINLFVNQI